MARFRNSRWGQPMTLHVAAMVIDDYDEVYALWEKTEGVGLNETDRRESVEAYLGRNPGLSLVARAGQRLVAALLCGHDGRRGYIHHLAVEAEYRGQGLGRRMVQQCLARLAEAGIDRCNVLLLDGNDDGERFWRKLGWRDREELKVMQRKTLPAPDERR